MINCPKSNRRYWDRTWVMLLTFLLSSALPSLASECGFAEKATPVPQRYADLMGPTESLWPTDETGAVTFKPATDMNGVTEIPRNRDSSSWRTQTIAGEQAQHWLFMDVAAPEGNDDWLFVAYNAGLQAWDLRTDPAGPSRVAYREGWMNHFFEFPSPGEVETLVETIDATQAGNDLLVGLAGRNGHGFSLWEFTAPNTFTQHCQDTTVWGRNVEVVYFNNRAYAFVADISGVHVYDATSAMGAGTSCFKEGKVGDMTRGNYTSVLEKDGDLFVVASDGIGSPAYALTVELWKVDPENPELNALNPNATRKLYSFDSSYSNSRGVSLFKMGDINPRYFLALIKEESGQPAQLEIYDVESCLEFTGAGTCSSLGTPLVSRTLSAINGNLQFFDISQSADGRTWGYYGMEVTNLTGGNVEELLDLTPLATATSPITLSEITDGGDTYTNQSPCANTQEIDYWGNYYPANIHGIKWATPRHGIFIGNHFYRAGYGFVDIHEIVNTVAIPSITTEISDGVDTLWLDETASFEGTAGGGCSPVAGNWCWFVEAASSDGTDVVGFAPDNGDCSAAYTNPEDFDFSCTPGGGQARCDDITAMVTAWNTACGPQNGGQTNAVNLTLKDPTVDIDAALDTGGSTDYLQCQTIPLDAAVEGRGPISWEWQVDGEPLDGCSGSVSTMTDVSTADFSCLWDTTDVRITDEIFLDGFETADVSRWSSSNGFAAPRVASLNKARRSINFTKGVNNVNVAVSLVVSNGGELDSEGATINIAEISAASFVNGGNPFTAPVVNGNVATLQAPANNTSSWVWEIEDPDAGTAPCSFNGAAVCVTSAPQINDTLQYAWTSDGTYTYKVTISNCQPGASQSASSNVTVSAAVAPTISSFALDGANSACCGSPNFGITCVAGQAIDVRVALAEQAAYTFGFDWERTSTASATYTNQNATGNTGSDYFFTYTFSNSGSARTVHPIVRVTSGTASATESFLSSGGVTVLPAGSVCQ